MNGSRTALPSLLASLLAVLSLGIQPAFAGERQRDGGGHRNQPLSRRGDSLRSCRGSPLRGVARSGTTRESPSSEASPWPSWPARALARLFLRTPSSSFRTTTAATATTAPDITTTAATALGITTTAIMATTAPGTGITTTVLAMATRAPATAIRVPGITGNIVGMLPWKRTDPGRRTDGNRGRFTPHPWRGPLPARRRETRARRATPSRPSVQSPIPYTADAASFYLDTTREALPCSCKTRLILASSSGASASSLWD